MCRFSPLQVSSSIEPATDAMGAVRVRPFLWLLQWVKWLALRGIIRHNCWQPDRYQSNFSKHSWRDMPLDFAMLCNKIEIMLDETEAEYQQVPGLILTEDDLKCVIYKKLTDLPSLSDLSTIENNKLLANPVHTEIFWYDENGRLALKPDITIIEPENLSILGQVNNDFEFGGNAIIFELKFVSGALGIHPRIVERIKADYRKIMRLFAIQEDADCIFCYQVIFNRTNVKCKAFDDFLRQFGIRG